MSYFLFIYIYSYCTIHNTDLVQLPNYGRKGFLTLFFVCVMDTAAVINQDLLVFPMASLNKLELYPRDCLEQEKWAVIFYIQYMCIYIYKLAKTNIYIYILFFGRNQFVAAGFTGYHIRHTHLGGKLCRFEFLYTVNLQNFEKLQISAVVKKCLFLQFNP